tara:strand:+ start:1767 stop:1916 length:150 start_codon:yes stop_codon:yes gene_type:complete
MMRKRDIREQRQQRDAERWAPWQEERDDDIEAKDVPERDEPPPSREGMQ